MKIHQETKPGDLGDLQDEESLEVKRKEKIFNYL
jgi:hypothetical protein